MESYLQYRRFGRSLEQQLQRHSQGTRQNLPHDSSDNKEHQELRFAAVNSANDRTFNQDIEKQNGIEEEKDTDIPSPGRESIESVESVSSPTEPQESESNEDDATDGSTFRRVLSRATTRSNQSFGTRLGSTLTGVEARNRNTNDGGDKNAKVFVVSWQGEDDPLNPYNWSKTKKAFATLRVASIGAVVGVASSIDSSALQEAAAELGVSEVAESLSTGLYLAGFGAGGLFAGPISEALGRNPVYIATLSLFMVFVMASALAPNIGAQLAFRFLAGLFGSTPLTCAGGSVADLWTPLERVLTFPVFANAAFMGPVLGPVMGGFIVQSTVISWRWTDWVTLIIAGLVTISVVLFQPETYQPVLLHWKAKHLRRITGDDRYRAPLEVQETTFMARLKLALSRPFILTAQEPIIILITLYLTVIYVVLFTFLDGYDYIFAETYGLGPGLTGLCFVGIAIGLCISSAFVPIIYKWAKRDLAKIKEQGGDRLPPEFRLWFAMLGGSIALPVGIFWMAWTSYPWISIWSPLAASVLIGYGILAIFISSYQYIIDSYEVYAASALASVTVIRYVVSGGMAVVGIPFYENLGVQWTLTILGGISALMAPLPYIFFKYGPWIRKRSKYAPTD